MPNDAVADFCEGHRAAKDLVAAAQAAVTAVDPAPGPDVLRLVVTSMITARQWLDRCTRCLGERHVTGEALCNSLPVAR